MLGCGGVTPTLANCRLRTDITAFSPWMGLLRKKDNFQTLNTRKRASLHEYWLAVPVLDVAGGC